MAGQPADEHHRGGDPHPQDSDPAAELTPRVTERLAEVDTPAAADRVAAGRHPGWFLPPTGCLDTPPDEERGYVAADDLDLVPEERDGTGGIAPAAPR